MMPWYRLLMRQCVQVPGKVNLWLRPGGVSPADRYPISFLKTVEHDGGIGEDKQLSDLRKGRQKLSENSRADDDITESFRGKQTDGTF